jgi:four helix bundle protein
MNYDLEKRTTDFSKDVINFCKKIKITPLNSNIVSQLLRSATSVGANYREANASSSKSDFRNKIHISRKEVQETEYWLELLAEVNGEHKERLRKIWKEAHELSLIFNKISFTLRH